MITMNGGVASYHPGPQIITPLCTALAETIASAKLVTIKYRVLLFDLQSSQEEPIVINSMCVWIDNCAALGLAAGNDFIHETVKDVTV
jgi:hypothetical protein